MRTFKFNEWLYDNMTEGELTQVIIDKEKHLEYHVNKCKEVRESRYGY